MEGTHYAFLHPANMYHSPYVLEYWSDLHGKSFFGDLSRSTREGEDPVMTYKRINSLTQSEFNDEMFTAYQRFITWDLKRVDKVAQQYANQHKSLLVRLEKEWFRIDSSKCPQNYGYNGIKLVVPEAGTNVVVKFRGIAGAVGYSSFNKDKAGWRYGFVASLKSGKRVYSDIYKDANGSATFKVPEDVNFLWLVVSGAPTEHWPIVFNWENAGDKEDEEQWPYMINISGTGIDNSMIKYES
jgi:hypothetical protein